MDRILPTSVCSQRAREAQFLILLACRHRWLFKHYAICSTTTIAQVDIRSRTDKIMYRGWNHFYLPTPQPTSPCLYSRESPRCSPSSRRVPIQVTRLTGAIWTLYGAWQLSSRRWPFKLEPSRSITSGRGSCLDSATPCGLHCTVSSAQLACSSLLSGTMRERRPMNS